MDRTDPVSSELLSPAVALSIKTISFSFVMLFMFCTSCLEFRIFPANAQTSDEWPAALSVRLSIRVLSGNMLLTFALALFFVGYI